MISRLADMVVGSADLFEAEGRLLRQHVVRTIVALSVIVALVTITLVSALTALVGLVLILRGFLGLPYTLMSVGCGIGILVAWVAWLLYQRAQ